MAYTQMFNKKPRNKTGDGLPEKLINTDPENPKAKVGEIPQQAELQERFKGRYTVTPKPYASNEYSLIDKKGKSVSYIASPKVEEEPSYSVSEIMSMPSKNKK